MMYLQLEVVHSALAAMTRWLLKASFNSIAYAVAAV